MGMGWTGGCAVAGYAEGRSKDSPTPAMGTGNDFANPVGGERDMAPAVLAGALEMRLGFWHELPPIYDAAGLLNTEKLGIGAGSPLPADFQPQVRRDKSGMINGPGLS